MVKCIFNYIGMTVTSWHCIFILGMGVLVSFGRRGEGGGIPGLHETLIMSVLSNQS